MKNIQVSDEMYDTLMELSKELNTQNYRGTAMPYFFQVRSIEEYSTGEGQGESVYVMDGAVIKTDAEKKEAISEYNDWDEDESNEQFKELDEWDINTKLEEIGFHVHYMGIRDNLTNAFLTEKACKKHIEMNGYHYNQPMDYLSHGFRNPELELVMKFITEISGGSLHK